MKQPAFKINDWCFCEFKLQQIKKTQDDRITEVSDGMFSHGSSDLTDRCFPLEMAVKRISDSVKYWSDKFHALENNSLNHPDLNRALISRWVAMCEARYDEELLKTKYKELEQFGQAVVRRVNDLRYEAVEDVNLFRR